MAADAYVRIGSETKTFTVTALLELVDDGRLGLDDPISAYIDGVPNGDRITPRHPAGMRGGLFPYTSDPDFIHDPQGAEFPEPHPRGYTDQTLSGSVADATDRNPSWAWAAGAMISDLHDLRRWAEVVATGGLLSPETQAQGLRTLPTGFPGTSYGLGILETNGWTGHNGSIPGYETVTVYLPSQKATWSS